MRAMLAVLFLGSGFALADSIYVHCGKHRSDGADKAEFAYSSMTLTPRDRSEFSLAQKGKENERAESIVVLRREGRVSGYVITETARPRGYRQYVFSGVESCQEGGPAYLQVYKVGTGSGRVPQGRRKPCVCGVD